ncbi:hypothetical protein EVG20_g396 [Dentipellis fragilis]|uniref:AAA+ ATPase domain-containing protein n=1 Tax=Dentipellis fragilis TaxID=205917 RepID=A0A4Y9ZCU8_9AGAM|nr:hypothetical protein EVG20_g396 [Dentipellis fragilis]
MKRLAAAHGRLQTGTGPSTSGVLRSDIHRRRTPFAAHRYRDQHQHATRNTNTTTPPSPSSPSSDPDPVSVSGLPQQTDLLEQYRALVALGRIQHDDAQVRVIMQLRGLRRELDGYAPPALVARHLDARSAPGTETETPGAEPWWKPSERENEDDAATDAPSHALTRVLTHAEELAALTTPKVNLPPHLRSRRRCTYPCTPPPQGLLITGPPGAGKTFLIDLWLASMPTPHKARKHYSELVLEIYRAVWEETQRRMAALHQGQGHGSPNPEPEARRGMAWGMGTAPDPPIAYAVARRLVLAHWLLVFDEVQLLDVSSATLLADVLAWFWRMGGVLVGSSNRVPDDLYRNGVQRERLEPFVEAMKVRCPVMEMRCPVMEMRVERDWREVRAREGERMWFGKGREGEFERRVEALAEGEQESKQDTLQVFGRPLQVPWSRGGICKFSFSELCEESLGAADYMSLASTYHTLALTHIPILHVSSKNQARRFISLIDALYEARCRLVCLADAEPEDLFFPDGAGAHMDMDSIMAEAVSETQDVYRPNVASYDAPQMAQARVAPSPLALETLSIFSGKDEQFAYKRALSRLLEMTSASYACEERWTPLPAHARKWERAAPNASTSFKGSKSARPPTSSDSDGGRSDRDAAYTGGRPLADRPEAPRVREHHIWGIADSDSSR